MIGAASSEAEARADLLIYVQHLLGVGHLVRAVRLARAAAEQGLDVLVVSGGEPVAGLDLGPARLEQLVPVKAGDAGFSFLADSSGERISDSLKCARRQRLLSLLDAARPKVIVTEMFPFGRRALRFELLPFLEAARGRDPAPKVVCSLRDVLNHPLPEKKSDWIVETANRLFDLILVHGDPAFLPLDESFPRVSELACPLIYSGYIAPELSSDLGSGDQDCDADPATKAKEVVISAGGGAVGLPLMRCAIAARPYSRLRELVWRILVGPNVGEGELESLAGAAADGVVVERPKDDLHAVLANAKVSVSQGGYNSLIEILQTRVPAVVVPFADGGETEQTTRARALERTGLVGVLEAEKLSPVALADAIDRQSAKTSSAIRIDCGGTEKSAAILADLARGEGP